MLKSSIISLAIIFSSINLASGISVPVEAAPAATPYTIALQSRTSPKGSLLRRRALEPINVPLDDFFLETDLQWFGNITVGTPPQTLTVVFDTGSTTLEITSDRCKTCPQAKFNTTASSTFVDGNQTATISFDTGGGVDPVINHNYNLTLHSATDTVGLPGGFSAPNMDVFLIIDQTPKFNIDPYSGIQGLGASAQGLFAALVQQGLPSLFSIYFTPKAVGHAELTLGGINNTKFTGEPIYGSVPPDPSGEAPRLWVLPSPGIAVNGHTTVFLNTSRNIIFDSGTSNVLFSKNTTEAIYALISPDIKPNADLPGTYGIACDRIASLPANIDLAFTSQNGTAFNLTIPSSELSVGPFNGNSSICQTLINALDLDVEEGDIVGGSLMKHYYTIFDIGAQRIGFAPSANVSSTGNATNTGGGSGNNTEGSSNKPSSAPARPMGANFASVAVLMGLALSLGKL